jgi:hypothetical protein
VTPKWTSSVVNGQTILSTSEARGSVTLPFDGAHTPDELATMAEEALEWVNTSSTGKTRPWTRPATTACTPLSAKPSYDPRAATGRSDSRAHAADLPPQRLQVRIRKGLEAQIFPVRRHLDSKLQPVPRIVQPSKLRTIAGEVVGDYPNWESKCLLGPLQFMQREGPMNPHEERRGLCALSPAFPARRRRGSRPDLGAAA